MKKQVIFSGLLILKELTTVLAQNPEKEKKPFTLHGYIEGYYVYDFKRPKNNTQPNFIYSYNKTNEVHLNLGFLNATYKKERFRINLTLATGTYMNANYATESGIFKNAYEAHINIKISKKQNIWIAVGIMPSHMNFKSSIRKNNWTRNTKHHDKQLALL